MEDKSFELLSKFYGEFTEFRSETNKRFDSVDTNINTLDKRLTKIETIIENDIKPDLKAVYQIQSDTIKKLDEHDQRFDEIDGKLENLQTEVNVLSGKYKTHSYEIGALKRKKKV